MREFRAPEQRYVTDGDGTRTFHSFSYGAHYDPGNVGFGALRAINVEYLEPGTGYDSHHHADVEIVTWVISGELAHEDTTGAGGSIAARRAQRLSAGDGVRHSERNASDAEPLVFVQTMLTTQWEQGPEYADLDVPVAPGQLSSAVTVHAAAELLIADLDGPALDVPPAARRLVHVTRGEVISDGQRLPVGSEIRTDDAEPLVLASDSPAEALVWLLRS